MSALTAAPVPDPDRWTIMEAELYAWRQAHPDATWVEIETELDRCLDVLRAAVLGEVVTDTPERSIPCPACGGRRTITNLSSRTSCTYHEYCVWNRCPCVALVCDMEAQPSSLAA